MPAKHVKSTVRNPQTALERVRAIALAYPDAHEEFPWGESAFKVRGKTFVFTRETEEGLGITVKLPRSREFALDRDFTEPTGYGLGKSGWITARFPPNQAPPMDLIAAWIDESYRAIAPKKLVAQLPNT